MTYPIPNYTRVWVRGRIIDLGKAALQEDNYGLALPVTFSPSPKVLLNAGTGQIISTASFKITPAAQDGYFAIQLPATDDPDINPTNFTYSVKEPTGRSYNIVVPAATPALNSPGDPLHGQPVLDLITIVPSPPAGAGSVQLLTGTPGRGIVSTDNVAGDLVITYTDSTTQNLGPVSGGASSLSELDDVTITDAAVGDVVTFTQVGASPTFGKATPYGLGAYTVTGVDLTGVTDASAAIQAAIDAQAAKANGGTVYLPAGRYRVDTTLVPKSKVTVIGAGRNLTRLLPYGAIACFERLGSTASPLDDAHFADFTIDGTNQTGPYATRIKGFYITWLRRCSFNRLRVYNTGATGVGTDHHVDCEMNDIIAESCGRLNDGTQGGGAGIGIGTGGWLSGSETLVISGCVTKNNKRCGLFFETQNGGLLMGTRVIGHHSEGNGEHGIADAGCNGLVVSGGMSKSNQGAGFAMYAGTIEPGQPGTYGIVIGMSLVDNISDGVIYDATTRETTNPRYTIRGCKIRGNWGHGVFIRAGATVDPSQLTVVDNDINSNQKAGIYVTSAGASVTDLDISGNRIYSNGLNTGAAERQGIRIQCSTTRLRVTGNRAWDTQTTKTQTYGLQLAGGTTATDAYFDGNDFRANATGGANISGTIGNGSVIGPNNAGWTVKAGSPEGAVKAPAGTLYRRTDGDAATTLYVKATNGDPVAGTDLNGWVAK